jgi:carboxypeptidase Taq
VHRHGALIKPADLLQRVTGEPLNPQFLLDYLAQKIAVLR